MVESAANSQSPHLAAPKQSALALAEHLMAQPGHISPELAAQLGGHFTQDQIIELTLDVMKWNYQKVAVAFRIDAEVAPGQVTALHFDADGHWIRPPS